MQYVIRLAPEVAIKSPRIRAKFVRRLVRNIKAAMGASAIPFTLRTEWSRLYLASDDDAAAEVLQRVFGIESISPVEHQCEPTEEVLTALMQQYIPLVRDKTFAVRVKRTGLPGRTSMQWEQFLGGQLWAHSKGVSLKHPEQLIEVELREDVAYVFTQRFKGPGGLPLGVQGKSLCLLSGGIDSSVAAWKIMKRGCALDFVFFNLGGAAYERSVIVAAKGLVSLWSHGYAPTLYIVPFHEVATNIKKFVHPPYAQVVLKRLMYRAASELAAKIEAEGFVTGESIGQVSSQTLANLRAIDAAATTMVLRPLAGDDKEDVIRLARQIQTLTLTEHVQEYCALVLKNPVTATSPDRAAYHEHMVPPETLPQAMAGMRAILVNNVEADQLLADYIFVDRVPENAAVIDCRPQKHFEAWHYPGAERHDPDWLMIHYGKLPRDKTYVLYCPYGMQSAVIAEKMQGAGFEAYSVRGGTSQLKI